MALERRILEGDNNDDDTMPRNYPGILTGDTTPTPAMYINTPTLEQPENSEDEDQAADGELNSMNGQLVGEDILENQKSTSRKMERRQKHEMRMERRYRRAIRGHMKQSRSKSSLGRLDLDSGSNLIRARRARPCVKCHVPYHHKFAPFANLKLVPW